MVYGGFKHLDDAVSLAETLFGPHDLVRIAVDSTELRRLGLELRDIGARIEAQSQDLPAGLVGESHGTRELRSLNGQIELLLRQAVLRRRGRGG